jgi:hypothetical protein
MNLTAVTEHNLHSVICVRGSVGSDYCSPGLDLTSQSPSPSLKPSRVSGAHPGFADRKVSCPCQS